MPDWLFAVFAYFGMFCAAAIVLLALFIGFLALRRAAP